MIKSIAKLVLVAGLVAPCVPVYSSSNGKRALFTSTGVVAGAGLASLVTAYLNNEQSTDIKNYIANKILRCAPNVVLSYLKRLREHIANGDIVVVYNQNGRPSDVEFSSKIAFHEEEKSLYKSFIFYSKPGSSKSFSESFLDANIAAIENGWKGTSIWKFILPALIFGAAIGGVGYSIAK